MPKLPAFLTWTQALNWMVCGEPRDTDPGLVLDLECSYAAAFGEPAPVRRMSLERARAELLDRLETGAAIATGEQHEAIGLSGFSTESLPSDIPASAWPNLRLDDRTSFGAVDRLKVSIPGQGYANVRLRRDDVIAAYEAVVAEQRAEQRELIGLLAPVVLVPEQPPQNSESPRARVKRLKREAAEYLDAQATAARAAGDLLDGADTMRRSMPGSDKVDRKTFRELHKEVLVKHGVGARGAGRPAR